MNALARLLRPRGITVDLAIPNWLVLLARMSVALFVLGVLALMLLSFALLAFRDDRGGDTVWTSPMLSVDESDFSARPPVFTVQLTAGSDGAKDLDREWTLLLSSGAVHWANVVEGPRTLAAGETGTFRLTFLFEPRPEYGEPVSLRWDPGRKVTAWVSLGVQEP